MEKRDDRAGPVTQSVRNQAGAGQRESRLRSTVRRETAALALATPQHAVGPKGELYRGFGDGFTRAFELAVTPVIFGAMGYGLDRWLGVLPVFTTIFVLLTVVGLLLRTWYGYVYRMQAIEASGPWARRPPATMAAARPDTAATTTSAALAPRLDG